MPRRCTVRGVFLFRSCSNPLTALLPPWETVCCRSDPLSVPNVWRGVLRTQQLKPLEPDQRMDICTQRARCEFVCWYSPADKNGSGCGSGYVPAVSCQKQVPSRSRPPLSIGKDWVGAWRTSRHFVYVVAVVGSAFHCIDAGYFGRPAIFS